MGRRDGIVREVDLQPRKVYGGLEAYLADLREHLKDLLTPILKQKYGLNFWLIVEVTYSLAQKVVGVERCITLHAGKLVIFRCNLEEKLKQATDVILQRNKTTLLNHCEQILDSIHNTRFKIMDYHPFNCFPEYTSDTESDDDG